MIETRVRDKQALRLSSGSSHVETQNFASDIVICVHFFKALPPPRRKILRLYTWQTAGSEAWFSCRTNENPYPELA